MSSFPPRPAGATPPTVVRTRRLGVRRGDHELLRDVDLTVARGERIALLGPSGAGKSMLVRALLGVLPPPLRATGVHEVHGRAAWVQQDPSLALHPSVVVGRQLGRPLRRRGARSREARARVLAALEEVGLDAARVAGAVPSELSGGERQRVCVALAVLGRAEVLLADEPTTSLDTLSQAAVVEALRCTPGALVLVTHDVAVAAALCNRVVVLAEGAVVEQAEVGRLLHAPRHRVTRDLVTLASARGVA